MNGTMSLKYNASHSYSFLHFDLLFCRLWVSLEYMVILYISCYMSSRARPVYFSLLVCLVYAVAPRLQAVSFFLVRRTKRARRHTRVTEGARRERLSPSFLASRSFALDALPRAWLTEEKGETACSLSCTQLPGISVGIWPCFIFLLFQQVDTEVCEQTFACLSKYAKITLNMNKEHFVFYNVFATLAQPQGGTKVEKQWIFVRV